MSATRRAANIARLSSQSTTNIPQTARLVATTETQMANPPPASNAEPSMDLVMNLAYDAVGMYLAEYLMKSKAPSLKSLVSPVAASAIYGVVGGDLAKYVPSEVPPMATDVAGKTLITYGIDMLMGKKTKLLDTAVMQLGGDIAQKYIGEAMSKAKTNADIDAPAAVQF